MPHAELVLNGQPTPLGDIAVHTTVLEWLRNLGLTGCKEGCAEGECGACSVLVARPAKTGTNAVTEWVAVNACLAPVASMVGQEIVTAEGLGRPDHLHPVQHEMAVRGGSQCGYCTPGFICSMAAEYYRPGRNDFDPHALSGNLCRCTGYRPIRDAAEALGAPEHDDPLAARRHCPAPEPTRTQLVHEERSFLRPTELSEALQSLYDLPTSTVIAGCTDWGVEVNLRSARADHIIAIDQLAELRTLTITDESVQIGAALTLSEIETALGNRIPLIAKLIPQFASRLIRNTATLGGNLGTASPIGDAAPVLLALDASVQLVSVNGEREIALADYFTDYRQTLRRDDELIQSVRIPLPVAELSAFHKIAKRRYDDISGVAIAIAVAVADGVVRSARVGIGGVAATPLRALATEAVLLNAPWNMDTVRAAAEILRTEGTPVDDHRASARYRRAMLGQSLLKFYADTTTGSQF